MFVEIIAMIALICGSLRHSYRLWKKREDLNQLGMSLNSIALLITFLFLYVVPLLILLNPKRDIFIQFYFPVPFITLLFFPGVLYSRYISRKLEAIGTDFGVKMQKLLLEGFWIGIGGIAIILSYWLWWLSIPVENNLPIM